MGYRTATAGLILALCYVAVVLLSRNYPIELGTWRVPGRVGGSYQWVICMTVLPPAVAALLLTERVQWPSQRARVLGWLLGLAVMGEVVAALTSASPVDSLSYYVLPHLALWLLFVALVSTPLTAALRWLALGLVLATLIQSLIATYQGATVTLPTVLGYIESPHPFAEPDDVKWTRFPPASGLTAWPTILAAMIVVLGPLTLLLKDRRQRVGVVCVLAVALLLSFGRSAWLALGMATLAGGVIWMQRRRARTAGVGAMVVLLATVGIVGIEPRLIDIVAERLPIAPASASRDERELGQEVAIGLWRSRPIFGVGPGNSAVAARQHQEFADEEERIVPAHNWLVLSLAERGIVGALATIVLWAGPTFWLLLRGQGRTDAMFAASFTALAVSQWFDYQLSYWIGGYLLQVLLLALWLRSSTVNLVPVPERCREGEPGRPMPERLPSPLRITELGANPDCRGTLDHHR